MKIVEGLLQNSPDWHQYRKTRIGASDVPAIMGVSKWETPNQLWSRKLGLLPEKEMTDPMREGHRKELMAREHLKTAIGAIFHPVVLESETLSYLCASLDGLCVSISCEIKSPGKKDHELARLHIIPPHYFPQLMTQLHCTGHTWMYYVSYVSDDDCIIFKVYRDDEYIDKMLEKIKEFKQNLDSFTPPELCDDDYQIVDNDEWTKLAHFYKCAKQKGDYWKDIADKSREQMIEMANGQSSIGAGIKLSKYSVKGRVDHKKMIDDYDIDENRYRKPSTVNWRISECQY